MLKNIKRKQRNNKLLKQLYKDEDKIFNELQQAMFESRKRDAEIEEMLGTWMERYNIPTEEVGAFNKALGTNDGNHIAIGSLSVLTMLSVK